MIAPSQLQVLATERHYDAGPMKRLPRRRRRHGDSVEIRVATSHDAHALHELQELDGRTLTEGSRLVAEVGGVPVAAIAVSDGTVVADPFEHTSSVVDLLRLRARQLRIAGTPRPAPKLALIERLAR